MGASSHHGLHVGGTTVSSPYAQPSSRPPNFRVRVYNDRLFQSLLEDGGKASSTSPRSFGRSVKSRCDMAHFHYMVHRIQPMAVAPGSTVWFVR